MASAENNGILAEKCRIRCGIYAAFMTFRSKSTRPSGSRAPEALHPMPRHAWERGLPAREYGAAGGRPPPAPHHQRRGQDARAPRNLPATARCGVSPRHSPPAAVSPHWSARSLSGPLCFQGPAGPAGPAGLAGLAIIAPVPGRLSSQSRLSFAMVPPGGPPWERGHPARDSCLFATRIKDNCADESDSYVSSLVRCTRI